MNQPGCFSREDAGEQCLVWTAGVNERSTITLHLPTAPKTAPNFELAVRGAQPIRLSVPSLALPADGRYVAALRNGNHFFLKVLINKLVLDVFHYYALELSACHYVTSYTPQIGNPPLQVRADAASSSSNCLI
jgi:hypothetical protein